MKTSLRRASEICIIVLITGLSVAVFLLRNRIGSLGAAGYPGLFFLCLLANATVLLPAPSLMIAASCGLVMNPTLVALVAAAGSALGELVGYVFGNTGSDLSPRFQGLMIWLNGKIRHPALLVFLLALLPLPLFDVAGVYSGGTKMHPGSFLGMCFLGKLLKMLVYARLFAILAWSASYLGI